MGLNAYYNSNNKIGNLANKAQQMTAAYNQGQGTIAGNPRGFNRAVNMQRFGSTLGQGLNNAAPMMNALSSAYSTQYVPNNVWQGYGNVGSTEGGQAVSGIGGMAGNAIGGNAGMLVSGVSGMAGNLIDMFSYNPEVTPLEDSMYSQDELPTYNLGEEKETTRNLMDNAMKSARRKMWANVGSGAAAGAAAGTMASPGWGTAIGAVGGAAVGLGTGLWGKNSVKNQAARARNEMEQEYGEGVGRLNTATENYYERGAGKDRYAAIRRSQGGLFDLPSYSPYFGL